MKIRLLFFYLALGSFFMYSCSDDDSDGSDFGDLPAALIGSWSSTELSLTGCADTGDNGSCSIGCLSLIFAEGGGFTGTLLNSPILGTATATDELLKLCDPTGDCIEVMYSIGTTGISISWTDSEDGCTYSGMIVQPLFPSELVGTWISNAATATGCDDSTDDGTCQSDCLTYTFSTSGVFSGTFNQEPQRTGFGYASGSTLNLCWSGDFACQEVTYDVTGNTGEVSWKDNEDGCSRTATITKQ